MLNRLKRWWNRRLRKIDIDILWPTVCRRCQDDPEGARNVFHLHVCMDPAWMDLTEQEQTQIIAKLPFIED